MPKKLKPNCDAAMVWAGAATMLAEAISSVSAHGCCISWNSRCWNRRLYAVAIWINIVAFRTTLLRLWCRCRSWRRGWGKFGRRLSLSIRTNSLLRTNNRSRAVWPTKKIGHDYPTYNDTANPKQDSLHWAHFGTKQEGSQLPVPSFIANCVTWSVVI